MQQVDKISCVLGFIKFREDYCRKFEQVKQSCG